MQFRPTPAEKKIIRECASRASRAAGCSTHVALMVAERIRIGGSIDKRHINVRLISADPDWNDTDLFDTLPWGRFAGVVELTEDGRGLFDFYVYEHTTSGELATNVQAHIEGGRLVRVAEERKTLWEAA